MTLKNCFSIKNDTQFLVIFVSALDYSLLVGLGQGFLEITTMNTSDQD